MVASWRLAPTTCDWCVAAARLLFLAVSVAIGARRGVGVVGRGGCCCCCAVVDHVSRRWVAGARFNLLVGELVPKRLGLLQELRSPTFLE